MVRAFLFALLLLPATATAADLTAGGIISEVKGGIMYHDSAITDPDYNFNPLRQRVEDGADLNAAILFNLPDWARHLYTPRLELGVNYSTAGDTNHAYAALNWTRDFGERFYLSGFFGLAVHDGKIDVSRSDASGVVTAASADFYNEHKSFGSRMLFKLGPELGYRLTENHNISLYWGHISNGWILASADNPNDGQDNIGVRYGYKF